MTPLNRRQFLGTVAAGAAAYADRVGLIPGIFTRWPELPTPMVEPVYALAYENPLALVALHAGNTDETRRRVAKAPPEADPARPNR